MYDTFLYVRNKIVKTVCQIYSLNLCKSSFFMQGGSAPVHLLPRWKACLGAYTNRIRPLSEKTLCAPLDVESFTENV